MRKRVFLLALIGTVVIGSMTIPANGLASKTRVYPSAAPYIGNPTPEQIEALNEKRTETTAEATMVPAESIPEVDYDDSDEEDLEEDYDESEDVEDLEDEYDTEDEEDIKNNSVNEGNTDNEKLSGGQKKYKKNDKLRLKWPKIKAAKRYRITKKIGKKWVQVKNTKKTTIKVTQGYKYKIEAQKKVKGKYKTFKKAYIRM